MEHELRRHIHNILKETLNTKRPFWKRIGDILFEGAIIVFAVSFAVFMERQREHSHDMKEAKVFILGLKTDLENDIKEMQEDIWGYETATKWLRYFIDEKKLNKDSVNKQSWVLINKTHLLINQGRYEGFKASGKINTIENELLRNKILDLYEERIVGLTNSTKEHLILKEEMLKVLYRKRVNRGMPNDNLLDILKDQELRNYFFALTTTKEIMNKYKLAIKESQDIIDLIKTEYSDR